MTEPLEIKYAPDSYLKKGEETDGANDKSTLEQALHSAAYSGLQSPLTGVLQLVDGAAGTDLAENAKIISTPESKEFLTKDWGVQTVSAAAGMILPFMAARRGAKGFLRNSVNRSALKNPNFWKSYAVKETATAGFIYGSVFHPTYGNESLVPARLRQGLVDAATFGTLAKASIATRGVGQNIGTTHRMGKALDNTVAASTIAGLPAGFVAAQGYSLVNNGELAGVTDTAKSMVEMSFVGMALSGSHQLSVTKGLANVEAALRKPNQQPVLSLGETISVAKNKAKVYVNEAKVGLDALVGDMALATNPYGQLAVATVGGGRTTARPGFRMEMSHEAPGNRGNTLESVGIGEKRNPTRDLTTKVEKEARIEREAQGRGVEWQKATDFLREQNQRELAEYIEATPELAKLKVNPEQSFYGNDSIMVVEVKPTKQFPNGAMLKATIPEGGWESNWGSRPGDAKLLSRVHEVELGNSTSQGTAYLYLQEKALVLDRYETHLVDEYFRGIEGKNLSFEEPGPNPNKQFGISQETGKLVLIDYPSTGKPGHMQTLTEITQGKQYFEDLYDRENFQRNRPEETRMEPEQAEALKSAESEYARHKVREKHELDATQKDILEQLSTGITPKEAAEYMALMRGLVDKNGLPDTKKVMPEINSLIKIAESEGVNF